MVLMMRRNTPAIFAALLLAVFLLSGSPALAQVTLPFEITGSGSGPDGLPLPGGAPRIHWAQGTATGLGKYLGVGTVQTLTLNLPKLPNGVLTGTFQSGTTFQFVGEHGDILACDYGHAPGPVGTFFLVPVGGLHYIAYFVAEFIPHTSLCTGKFAGVTGGWTMYAVSEPFVPGIVAPLYYSWQGEGSLTFPRGH